MSYLKIKKSNPKKERRPYKTLRPKRRVSTKESAQHEKTRQYSSTKHSDQKDASVQKSQHSTKRRFSTAVVSKDGVSTARTDVQYEKNSTVVSKDASHEKSLRLKCKHHMHPVKAPRPK